MAEMHGSFIHFFMLYEEITKPPVPITVRIVFFIFTPKQWFGNAGAFKLNKEIIYG